MKLSQKCFMNATLDVFTIHMCGAFASISIASNASDKNIDGTVRIDRQRYVSKTQNRSSGEQKSQIRNRTSVQTFADREPDPVPKYGLAFLAFYGLSQEAVFRYGQSA